MRVFAYIAATLLSAAPPAMVAAAVPKTPAAATPDKALLAAAEALASLDQERLATDKDYARDILAHADRIAERTGEEAGDGLIAKIRTLALMTLERAPEALGVSKAMIVAGTTDPWVYSLGMVAAAQASNMPVMVEIAEAAAAKLPADARPDFRAAVAQDFIYVLLSELHSIPGKELKQRFAEALLTLDQPEPDDVTTRDMYRSLVIDRYVKLGKIAEARALARQVVEPDTLVRLLVAKRFDPLFDGPADHRTLIQASLQSYDAATRRFLEASPDDPLRMLGRGQALRALGRDAEAVTLLMPFASDLKRVEAGGEKAFWIVNETALALSALGRHGEAVALMEKLLSLGLEKHPLLVSMAINHGEMLNAAGRHRDAAAHEAKLSGVGKVASPFGHMWIWSIAACGNLLGGDAAAAQPWLEKLAKNSDSNQAAHMRALLCANDTAGAEKLLIARLKGDEAVSMLLKLQNYELGTVETTNGKTLEKRFTALRDRPAVRAAIAETGRILSLPLAKTYWGDY
jgi:hypothetical protein